MNTSTETCPSLEDLAAFLDGRLSGSERARIVAHLADCPSCYEVFAEAARFQIEEEEEEEEDADPPGIAAPARVIPFPVKKILPWAAAIAAMLAIGVTIPPLYRQYNTMPELASAKLVSESVAGKVAGDPFWGASVVRGNPSGGFASIPHEILLGAHAVELGLSLARNGAESIDDLAAINGHIQEIGFLPDQEKIYKDIQAQIAGGKPPKDFVRQAEKVEASLPATDYPYFAFGKWAEAGRLSAVAESPDFFQAPDNRKFLRVFLHQERENLDPAVVEALQGIQNTLGDSDLSSLDYRKLNGLFESILTHYQRESAATD
jgi:hypothetical protein